MGKEQNGKKKNENQTPRNTNTQLTTFSVLSSLSGLSRFWSFLGWSPASDSVRLRAFPHSLVACVTIRAGSTFGQGHQLCSFPGTAVATDQKNSGLMGQEFIPSHFRRPEVQNQDVSRVALPPKAQRSPFPSSSRFRQLLVFPASLAHGHVPPISASVSMWSSLRCICVSSPAS